MLISDDIKEFDNIWSTTEILQYLYLSFDLHDTANVKSKACIFFSFFPYKAQYYKLKQC